MKRQRHNAIIDLVRTGEIASQEDLMQGLKARNIDVSQSTLSRDIQELGLAKAGGVYNETMNVLPGDKPILDDKKRLSIYRDPRRYPQRLELRRHNRRPPRRRAPLRAPRGRRARR